MGYHEITSDAAERFGKLRDELAQPFIDAWDSKVYEKFLGKTSARSHTHNLENGKWYTCAKHLSTILIRMRSELLEAAATQDCDQGTLITILGSQASSPRSTHNDCPYRSQKDDQILKELQERRLVCSEFLWRQNRIAALFHSRQHHSFDGEKVYADLVRLKSLCDSIKDEALYVIESGTLDKCAVDCLQAFNVEQYYLDEVASFRIFSDCLDGLDYCGRTTGHKFLDCMPHGPHREPYAKLLERYVKGLDDVNKQDGLGRTLLHIACIKNWHAGVEVLLQHGANLNATTVFGSLPLHYAAAKGTIRICQLLLRYNRDNAIALDEAMITPRGYALKEENTAIADLLHDTALNTDHAAPPQRETDQSKNYNAQHDVIPDYSPPAKNTVAWDHAIQWALPNYTHPQEGTCRSDRIGYIDPDHRPAFLSYPPLPDARNVNITLDNGIYERLAAADKIGRAHV